MTAAAKCITVEQAIAAAEVAVRTWDERQRREDERLKPKDIAVELGVSMRTVWRLVRRSAMPLDDDPAIGACVRRGDLERWRRNRTTAIEGFRATHTAKRRRK